MLFKKRFVGILLAGVALNGCEGSSPQSMVEIKPPLSSLNAKKELPPAIAHIFKLLKEEKYSEASLLINQTLQGQPKSVALHLLNALTYEKLGELGDATGNELAAVGYQNAINLDPTNVLAIIQLGKLKYREQMYAEAEEHFSNALLLKPDDANLWQELAAASYYAYDVKTALFAIDRAQKLKPNDPLINRSATMIYAALGDFDTAKKHFEVFKNKAGKDPAVKHVEARFNDWQSLYKSGRITLAVASTPPPATPSTPVTPPPTTSSTGTASSSSTGATGTASSGGGETSGGGTSSATAASGAGSTAGGDASGGTGAAASASPASGGGAAAGGAGSPAGGDASGGIGAATSAPSVADSGSASSGPVITGGNATEIGLESKAEKTLAMPFNMTDIGVGEAGGKAEVYNPQIVIDCYLLRITEEAVTSKGQNILENLAVTLTPGGYAMFKGSLWGKGPSQTTHADTVSFTETSGFNPNQINQAGPLGSGQGGAASAFTPSVTSMSLQNIGSLSGRVFGAGITWAGLTYNLNIANAIDIRTEVVSRPSLMTFLHKPSIFFSGDELVIGLTGQYGGTLVKYPVGVTLDITPQSIEGDIVTLNVGIEGSLLTTTTPNLTTTTDVAKTRIDTFVKIRLGSTLMLGGIYQRQEVLQKTGVPGLQDIPVVQYFFSNSQTTSTRQSIVFMLSPRSPDAVKIAVNRAMSRQAVEPHLGELIARSPDWFASHPNMVSIFRYLANDPVIFYEFRSGDILPPSWGWDTSLQEKLNQISAFVYF
ncbi:MAG: hypothetical protein BGO67_05770 [Alphaproteobacteria bacterium 41-28]|nr:MAG: hypothetical protein BGO67_05770 [Alphaproteobacteria bacterium 41-28]